MAQPVGRNLLLSLPRRFVCDLMHVSRGVPLIPLQRTMQLGRVAEARQAAVPRPGWCALFVKAYGLVAARRSELRRAYFAYPWPHLYEHPVSVASVAVERRLDGEDAVLFGHVRTPERQPLVAIEGHLRGFKEDPIESVALFRRLLRVSALPRPLRRAVWWYGLNSSGARRAKYMGTFGISSVAGLGGSILQLISPLTTTLTYGVLRPDGSMDVRVNFDHRVLDAGTAARALDELEQSLSVDVVSELRSVSSSRAA